MTIDSKEEFKGCILWGIIGDSIGSSFENIKNSNINDLKNISWQITDDSHLTLSTCKSIFESKQISPSSIAASMVLWYNYYNIVGLGASTLKALSELQFGGHWALVGRKGEYAAGNGAAMRAAPLAFVLDAQRFEDRTTIYDICKITHHNDEAYAGALAVILAIQYLVNTKDIVQLDFYNYIILNLPDTIVKDQIIKSSNQLELSILNFADTFGCSGYVAESVPFAIFCACQVKRFTMEEIFFQIITAGGDTDTNCSITGQICGSLLGSESIPEYMWKKLRDLKDFNLIKRTLSPIIELK
jgi:ADP-ribosylglycohydrolase